MLLNSFDNDVDSPEDTTKSMLEISAANDEIININGVELNVKNEIYDYRRK